eukprot:2493322-Prymnesium_polylepis.1
MHPAPAHRRRARATAGRARTFSVLRALWSCLRTVPKKYAPKGMHRKDILGRFFTLNLCVHNGFSTLVELLEYEPHTLGWSHWAVTPSVVRDVSGRAQRPLGVPLS